jgi:hypothetical protein
LVGDIAAGTCDIIDREGHAAYQARITTGLKLFGKYYQGLWN